MRTVTEDVSFAVERMWSHRPADDPPAERVLDDGEVSLWPALLRPQDRRWTQPDPLDQTGDLREGN